MKLEVGKYYKTRDGQKVGPMRNDWPYDAIFKWHTLDGASSGTLWDENGTNYYGTSPLPADLIAEWTDTPTIGTLAEIGAQVGDVVELMEPDTFRGVGALYEIEPGPSGMRYAQHKDGGIVNWGSTWAFRIVSRASDYQPSESECIEAAMAKGIDYPALPPQGPVTTETVTTKRIVPGVYGRVKINHHAGNIVQMQFQGVHLTAAVQFTRAELIEARDVFNQLIDAMPS